MYFLIALSLWCQFYTREILPSYSSLKVRVDTREEEYIENKHFWEWEEVFCSDATVSINRSSGVSGVRVLGNSNGEGSVGQTRP